MRPLPVDALTSMCIALSRRALTPRPKPSNHHSPHRSPNRSASGSSSGRAAVVEATPLARRTRGDTLLHRSEAMPLRRLMGGQAAAGAPSEQRFLICLLLAAAVGALLATSAQAFQQSPVPSTRPSAFTPRAGAAATATAAAAAAGWQRLPFGSAGVRRAQRTRLYSSPLPKDYYERLGVTRCAAVFVPLLLGSSIGRSVD